MTFLKIRLTQSYISSLKSAGKPYWITDAGCLNLRLYVGSVEKVWYVCYRLEGDIKKKSHKLGPAGEVLSVAQAREMANDFISRLKRGESPQKKKHPDSLLLKDFLKNVYEPWAIAERKSGVQTVYLLRLVPCKV
jgi:hypothetical protein